MGETNGSAEDGAGTGTGGGSGVTPTNAVSIAVGPTSRRTLYAGAFSIAWLVGFAALVWWKRCSIPEMPLNEIGDFLAGAFAPLAFLWLVVGYLQQGDELRQSTAALRLQEEALRLQVSEMKRMVEQQEELTGVAARQLDQHRKDMEERSKSEHRSAQPIVHLKSQSIWDYAKQNQIDVCLQNVGASLVRKVSLQPRDSFARFEVAPWEHEVFLPGSSICFRLILQGDLSEGEQYEAELHYVDRLGNEEMIFLLFELDEHGNLLMVMNQI